MTSELSIGSLFIEFRRVVMKREREVGMAPTEEMTDDMGRYGCFPRKNSFTTLKEGCIIEGDVRAFDWYSIHYIPTSIDELWKESR